MNKKFLKIAIIIILFLIIFISFIVISIRNINSIQFSKDKANLVVSESENTSNNTEENLEDEILEEDVFADSVIIRNLINNNWTRIDNNFVSEYEKDEDGNYIYDGYTIYTTDGVNIRNIVFNQDYETEVIAGLTVGATYEQIEEAFGVPPIFIDEDLGLYGYKTTSVYAFFYNDEISIYPNSDFNNLNFEEDLFEYIYGNYDGNQTNFVVKIRKNYPDFSAYLEDEDVILQSENRQIKIKLNGNYNQTEITLYNGYKSSSLMQGNLYKYDITEERETDLVELVETERIISE